MSDLHTIWYRAPTTLKIYTGVVQYRLVLKREGQGMPLKLNHPFFLHPFSFILKVCVAPWPCLSHIISCHADPLARGCQFFLKRRYDSSMSKQRKYRAQNESVREMSKWSREDEEVARRWTSGRCLQRFFGSDGSSRGVYDASRTLPALVFKINRSRVVQRERTLRVASPHAER